jgi:hypothetical protein
MSRLAEIEAALHSEALENFGAFTPRPTDAAQEHTRVLMLLGPREPGFWAQLTASDEWQDGAADPVDRWSTRVITALADRLGATAIFPFGGPPYAPFISWALQSGHAFSSPVGPLVHARAGLMVSYRGALAFSDDFAVPKPSSNPCDTCTDKPCLTTCPVVALSDQGYDTDTCHSYLDTEAGKTCMAAGCLVRRTCPVSQSYARSDVQSGYHMKQFHP